MVVSISFPFDTAPVAGFEQAETSQQEALAQETSRLFFELPFIGMAVTSPDSKKWLRVNQTLCDMLGYTREELLEKTWAELTHPEDRTRDLAQFEAILRGESEGHKQDKRYFHKSGAIVHTNVDVKAVRHVDGSVKFFVVTVADVTAQLNAEAEARSSAALMTKLAAEVPGVLYQLHRSTDGRMCCPFVSEGAQEVYEVTAEQVREDAWAILNRIEPEDLPTLLASMADSASTLEPWSCEYRVRHSQRGLRWLRATARPEALPDGSTLWHGFTSDITERHLEQEALAESEEQLRISEERLMQAVRCTQAGVFDDDMSGDSAYWSPVMYRICDVDPDEPASFKTFLERVHPDDRSGVLESIVAAEKSGPKDGRIDEEVRLIWRNGEERRLLTRSRTLFAPVDGELRPVCTIGAITDITEKHRAQETLLTLQVAVESSLSIVAMASLEGHLTYVNQAFLDLWGHKSVDEVLGKHVSTFWTSAEQTAEIVATASATGYWTGERTARREDGTERTLQLGISLFRDSQGTPAGFPGCRQGSSLCSRSRILATA